MPHVNHRRETVQKARARCRRGRRAQPFVTEYKHQRQQLFRRHAGWKLQRALKDDDLGDLWFPKWRSVVSDFWYWD